jgi:hypothetical protein
MACGVTTLLPIVRDPTADEIRGIKTGTRPDLVEAIREYERTLAAYNAELAAMTKAEAEAKALRSEAWWAKRIAKHPELAAEREARRLKKTLRQKRAELNARFAEKRAIARGAAPAGEAWWEIVADPVKYEAALRGEYNRPAQLPLDAVPA